jgi:hypothetical protein
LQKNFLEPTIVGERKETTGIEMEKEKKLFFSSTSFCKFERQSKLKEIVGADCFFLALFCLFF